MPILLLILSIATLATVATKSKVAPRPRGQTFTLDVNLPEALRNQVLAALVTGNDPATLDAFATAIQAQYPLSAALLHQRASALRAGQSAQPPPQLGQPGGQTLDANIPPSVAAFVQSELASDNDPTHLLALANSLAAQYPIAAGLLASKAAVLNVQPQTPLAPQPAPAPSPVAGPATPSAPVLTIPGLDPGMPPDVAQAVMGALLSETNPAHLQADAAQIQSQYPLAAGLLISKANSLLALAQSLTPPTPSTPLPAPSPQPVVAPGGVSGSMLGMDANMPPELVQTVLSALANEGDPVKLQALADQIAPQYPFAAGLLRTRANVILATRTPIEILPSVPSAPAGPAGVLPATYTVQQGDFAWKISAKLTGHGARWPELVAANPQKPRAKDGNFATLLPGEKLNLPGAWSAQPSPSAAPPSVAAAPAPSASPTPTTSAAAGTLDPGIPADIAAAVLAALQTATDATQVRGFASAVQQRGFPVAAGLLNAKANTLDAPPAQILPVVHTPGGAPPQPVPPGGGGGGTYKVKAGDNPSKIAAALVHDGNRWKELIAANPRKKKAANGNFASLQPGEVLEVPASWLTPTNGASAAPLALVHAPQGGA